MKFKNYLGLLFVFIATCVTAQSIDVKGKVTDSKSKAPLPGVNVTVKNSKKGVTTDFDGNYAIKANANDVLVFSNIGSGTKEVKVTKSETLNIQLDEEANKLEEVVINVGYGSKKKSVVTGAISKISASDLEKAPNGSIGQALQGRVSGVSIATNSGQPGAAATIRVRGITTFDTYGGNNPLWVVDGMIVDNGGIGYVNQSDIESVEVLKDAASLAIYGARSASGVILITTKKGKSGKLAVNYNGYTGVSAPDRTLKLLNATEYGALMNERSIAAGGPVVFNNLGALGIGTDWQKAVFSNDAMQHNHELSFSGGNDISTFMVSFGMKQQDGIVAKEISNYSKKNIRINSTHKVSDWLTIGENLGYSNQQNSGIGASNSEFGGVLSSAINLDPITPIIVTDPTAASASVYTGNPFVIRDSSGNPYGISSNVGQEMVNPVAYIKTRLGQFGWSHDIVGNTFVEIKPANHFKLKSTLGAKLAFWGLEGFTPKYYLSATTNVANNSFSRQNNKAFAWSIENTLNYSNKIGDHNFDVLLAQGAYSDGNVNTLYVTHRNLATNNYQDASFNDNTVVTADKTGSSFDAVEHRVSSIFTRLTYDFKEKYLFTGVMRRDGSTRFGSNNKYGNFPSFSLGWNVSKEDFWKTNNIVNQLKFRGGWGVTGNDYIGDFGYLATIGGNRNYTIGNTGAITSGLSPNAPSNPDLKWETTTQSNFGLEAKLFNNFNLVLDYYQKNTEGILQPVQLPGYIGATGSPLGNVADMTNKGWEVELGYKKKFGELNFSANGNISYNENEVTNIGEGKTNLTGNAAFQSMNAVTDTKVGMPYNYFWGRQTNGIFQSVAEVNAYTGALGLIQPNAKPGDFRWVDVNNDGKIDANDNTYLGNSQPKYNFGLTINLDYKGFDLMVFAQGSAGNKIFQGLRRLDIPTANYTTAALNRWTPTNPSNTFPRLTNTDTNNNFTTPSDFYLEKGDFLRMKLVQVGYSIPNRFTSKIGADKIRLYVSGENLYTFTKYSGYDPEIGGNVFGIDKGYYPQARTIMAGINLKF